MNKEKKSDNLVDALLEFYLVMERARISINKIKELKQRSDYYVNNNNNYESKNNKKKS